MRVLPLYKLSTPVPYLLASANWVLGELASCLPEVRFFFFKLILLFIAYIFFLKLFPYHSFPKIPSLSLSLSLSLSNVLIYSLSTRVVITASASTSKQILTRLFSIIQELSTDVYSSLLKALTMPDMEDISCYPVRVSAAGAITELVEVCMLPRSHIWFV